MISEATKYVYIPAILLLVSILLLPCCSSKDKFKIGQRVTNGNCTGVILNKYSDFAQLTNVKCLDFTASFININYSELRDDSASY